MTPLPRGRCPLCGKDVAVRVGGELREHRSGQGEPSELCDGSGLTLEAARERAQEQVPWRLR